MLNLSGLSTFENREHLRDLNKTAGDDLGEASGNVALKAAAKPPADLLAKFQTHKREIVALRQQEARSGGAAGYSKPDDAEIDEREGMAAASVPEQYLDARTRLQRHGRWPFPMGSGGRPSMTLTGSSTHGRGCNARSPCACRMINGGKP